MPVAIKSPFKPLTAAVSKYISSNKARVQAQKAASGTTSGPTGAEVDAHVASTLSTKQGAQILAQQSATAALDVPATYVDAEGRTLGLEDPNNPALVDSPDTAVRATASPVTVPTTAVTDPALLAEVSQITYGAQSSIPSFPLPTESSTALVDVNQFGFVDPRIYGGTSFDLVGDGMHEPLNVIISSLSSPSVLTRKGLQSYCRALDFDYECLGLHAGGYQKAYVDPRGWRDQEFIYREVYTPLDYVFGTCIESLVGGNHIRAWQQQGSGAWFLATSREENASKNHMIVPNGYNVGRNQLVQVALGKAKNGKTSFMWTKYKTEVQFVAGLMPQGVQGVNHDISVDGLTAVLTVTVLADKPWSASKEAKPATTGAEAAEVDTPAASGEVTASTTKEAEKKPERRRRISLAKRFSNSPAARESTAQQQQSRSQPVWQRLKRISAPKHQLNGATTARAQEEGATNEIVLAAKNGGLPDTAQSAFTAAESAGGDANINANKGSVPSGVATSAPALAA